MLPVTPLLFFSLLFLPSWAQKLPNDARYSAFQALADASTEDSDAILALEVPDGYVAAPWYPAPHGGWTPDWAEAYAKAEELVANMTLAEKTNITTGTGYEALRSFRRFR
jgi:hypothetical protein